MCRRATFLIALFACAGGSALSMSQGFLSQLEAAHPNSNSGQTVIARVLVLCWVCLKVHDTSSTLPYRILSQVEMQCAALLNTRPQKVPWTSKQSSGKADHCDVRKHLQALEDAAAKLGAEG